MFGCNAPAVNSVLQWMRGEEKASFRSIEKWETIPTNKPFHIVAGNHSHTDMIFYMLLTELCLHST